jgi:hypothetical protein
LEAAKQRYQDDKRYKSQLDDKLAILMEQVKEKQQKLKTEQDLYASLQLNPSNSKNINLQLDLKLVELDKDLKSSQTKLMNTENENSKLTERRYEAELFHKSILEKIQKIKETMSLREKEILLLESNRDLLKSEYHDELTKKAEVNLLRKEVEAELRHQNSQYHIIKRDYESAVRRLKKKRQILDTIRETIPLLHQQLVDAKMTVKFKKTELASTLEELDKLKEEVELTLEAFLDKGKLEINKKNVTSLTIITILFSYSLFTLQDLSCLLDEVDALDEEVIKEVIETKRLASILSSLSIQRDKKVRDKNNIDNKLKDIKNAKEIKDMIIVETTKRIHEISNRYREFLALYEIVKNERNQIDNEVQTNHQLLIETREKVRILTDEVQFCYYNFIY